MKKSASKLFAVVAAVAALAAAGTPYAGFSAGANQHLEKGDCVACHLAGKNVTAQQASMLTASQEALCGKCHPTATRVSHPSGFQPRTVPPENYPLDWKGDLTCSTCHDIHGNTRGLMRGAKAGKEFCFACHDPEFFKKMRDGGVSLMEGHLAKGADNHTATLDAYSLACMECHGENATPRLATSIDRNGIVRHASQSANHPIGMNYQKAVAYGGYRPRLAVERKLLLPDGKVGCVTCHSGYQKVHGKLVVSKVQSALCYECHDL